VAIIFSLQLALISQASFDYMNGLGRSAVVTTDSTTKGDNFGSIFDLSKVNKEKSKRPHYSCQITMIQTSHQAEMQTLNSDLYFDSRQ
jgi:hypothetical protein